MARVGWLLGALAAGDACRPTRRADVTAMWSDDNEGPPWARTLTQTATPGPPRSNASFEIHATLARALGRNRRPAYRAVAAAVAAGDRGALHDALSMMGKKDRGARIATFGRAEVDDDGLVVDSATCRAARQCGCCNLGRAAPRAGRRALPNATVTTLAMPLGAAAWHFPLEALVGLAGVGGAADVVHVTRRSAFQLDWLREAAGVPAGRVVAGPVAADAVVAPELARCGTPTFSQVSWLRARVLARLEDNGLRHVVLVKRTRSRRMASFPAVERAVRAYARRRGLAVAVHDDSQLPGLVAQWQTFRDAAAIVAPHGAGLVNLVAARAVPVVEFMQHGNVNLCFARLAYLLGAPYAVLPYKTGEDELADALDGLGAAAAP